MLLTQNKIKFLLQHSKLLKIAIFMIGSIFFTTGNANPSYINGQTDKSGGGSSFFLDIDSLQPKHNPGSLIIYLEKENPTEEWIFMTIKSSMTDYYKTVANVVATEFHKRIEEDALVPPTKFLIGKNMNNNGGYQLLGSAYKKFSFTKSILKVMKKRGLDDCANAIYKDHNIERNIGVWDYLGLSISPSYTVLELSEDNKFVRYDYYNSFHHQRSVIPIRCFCTSDFKISDHNCDIEYIKSFEQELRSKHKKTLEKIISEINEDSKTYLEGEDLQEVNRALSIISSK